MVSSAPFNKSSDVVNDHFDAIGSEDVVVIGRRSSNLN